jgi:hypothetical protein
MAFFNLDKDNFNLIPISPTIELLNEVLTNNSKNIGLNVNQLEDFS